MHFLSKFSLKYQKRESVKFDVQLTVSQKLKTKLENPICYRKLVRRHKPAH